MRNIFPHAQTSPNFAQEALEQKVQTILVEQVYSQGPLTIASSTFCAAVVFVGLYLTHEDRTLLWMWAILFLIITCLRFVLIYQYKKQIPSDRAAHLNLWKNLYVIGAALGGISWGLTGIMLLPVAPPIGKILIVLMLAGLTGGVVPLTSAVPAASVSFLILTIFPFIVVFATFQDKTYLLFDAALTLYLGYSIIIALRIYQLIKNSIYLQFENEGLLDNLVEAKQQLELTNKKLEHSATHDTLTQAANRSLFHTNIENAVKRAKVNDSIIALLYMDLDRFKLVNDAYGHAAGDKLLIQVIERLNGFLEKDSFIARWGGDEIAIILQNVSGIKEVSKIAEAICRLVAVPIKLDNIDIKISASIGISMFPLDCTDVASLMWHADKAMYYVKEHGGNHFAFFLDLRELQSS